MKYVIFCILLLIKLNVFAQNALPIKVAIFAPLYVDSAFESNNYKLGNNNLPKYLLPGLDFYHGVMFAVDSLAAEGAEIEVQVYDTKGTLSPQQIAQSKSFEGTSLMIASFNNRSEIQAFANIALQQKIPLISVTYPNDGGVVSNPYFAMLNTGLSTHCQEIYKYLQKNYSVGSNIVFVKGTGTTETVIYNYFQDAHRYTNSIPLKYKTITLTDTFTNAQISTALDSTKRNVVICGSVNESFGIKLVKTLHANHNYESTVIGMPTWDAVREFDKPEYKGITIVYSTPFNYNKSLPIAKKIWSDYNLKTNARPSDLVFKGFESVYHFTRLLLVHGSGLINHLSDNSNKLFNEFRFQPVYNKINKLQVDYFENKQLHFIKKGM